MRKAAFAVMAVVALGGLALWSLFLRTRPAVVEAEVETEVAVRLGQITRATLRQYVTAYGVIEPEPPGMSTGGSARITPASAGVIVSVACAEGQRVGKGTVLFQLDSRQADAAVRRARGAVALAEATFERQTKLLEVEGTSQKALLESEQALTSARSELDATETQQGLLRVEAPLAGTIARINVRLGESVDTTTTLAELVDRTRLVVSASVPSSEVAAIRVGQVAEVALDGAPAPLAAVVGFVSPQVDVKTGTAVVRATLSAAGDLRPGQLVSLRIVSAEHRDSLAVPVESVVKDSEGVTVIAVVRADRALQRPVKAGLRDGNLIEIEGEGVEAGLQVVTEGAYGLPKETKIRALGQ